MGSLPLDCEEGRDVESEVLEVGCDEELGSWAVV